MVRFRVLKGERIAFARARVPSVAEPESIMTSGVSRSLKQAAITAVEEMIDDIVFYAFFLFVAATVVRPPVKELQPKDAKGKEGAKTAEKTEPGFQLNSAGSAEVTW